MMLQSSQLVLYKASAGSGKTYALAREFLKIVISNPYDYKRILAVTFTRKATEEMKSRILENLAQLKNKDPKIAHLRSEILQALRPSFPEIDVHFDKHVALALELILHDYSNFNISTIDSFFQSIIRSFAKELDLPIGMEIELDTQSALGVAVENLLKDYESGKDDISDWIEAFVNDRIDDDKNWKIEDSLLQFSKELFNEDYRAIANEFALSEEKPDYKKIVQQIKTIIREYTSFFDKELEKLQEKIHKDGLDLSGFKRNCLNSFLKTVAAYDVGISNTLLEVLDTDIPYAKSAKLSAQEKEHLDLAWNTYIKPFVLNCQNYAEQHESLYISARAVLKNMYAFVLLDAINDQLKKYKADENLVLISDTNNIISLLSEKDAVPFIFEKSGSFLKYILLDEFQDTSLLQWKGLSKLVLEVLDNVNGIVLIVGDPKQSIYRWRGGKMNLIVDGIQQELQHHWKNKKSESLSDNYRSAKEIITFNNTFFNLLKERKFLDNTLFEAAYQDVEQNIKKTELSGYVRCLFFDADKRNRPDDEPDVKTKILDETVRTIKAFKNKTLADIAILTRTNTEGILVAQYLSENEIPVVSAESLLLYTHADIRLLMAALYYIYYSKEHLYAVQLNYLLAQRAGVQNADVDLKKSQNFDYPHIQKISLFSQGNLKELAQQDVFETVQQLLSAFDLLENEHEYTLRFQDIVLQHCVRYSNKLSDFLEFWEEQKTRFAILPPEGVNAVRIMTIHKSKGLQFPVVILPFASWDINPKHSQKIWVKSEVEPFNQLHAISVETKRENFKSIFADDIEQEFASSFIDSVNLLYVALTRAESELHLLSVKPGGKEDEVNKLNKITYPLIKRLNIENSVCTLDEFVFGKSDLPFPQDKKTIAPEFLQTPKWTDYKIKLKLRETTFFSKEQETGTLMHDTLASALGNHTASSGNEDFFNAEFVQQVNTLFEQHGWNDAKWRHLNEHILIDKQETLIPDKVLISDEEVIVIDYKTGKKNKQHAMQVQAYMAALERLFNKPIKGYLLYLRDMEMEEILK